MKGTKKWCNVYDCLVEDIEQLEEVVELCDIDCENCEFKVELEIGIDMGMDCHGEDNE